MTVGYYDSDLTPQGFKVRYPWHRTTWAVDGRVIYDTIRADGVTDRVIEHPDDRVDILSFPTTDTPLL